jgi:signal transduction histidine kinase
MYYLLSDIIDLSQIKNKTFKISPEQMDIQKTIESVVDLFSMQASAKNIELIFET